MKKDYFIDFSKNIITVSRSFFDEAAKDTESAAYRRCAGMHEAGAIK